MKKIYDETGMLLVDLLDLYNERKLQAFIDYMPTHYEEVRELSSLQAYFREKYYSEFDFIGVDKNQYDLKHFYRLPKAMQKEIRAQIDTSKFKQESKEGLYEDPKYARLDELAKRWHGPTNKYYEKKYLRADFTDKEGRSFAEKYLIWNPLQVSTCTLDEDAIRYNIPEILEAVKKFSPSPLVTLCMRKDNFIRNLKKLREDNNLTIDDIAEEAKVDTYVIAEAERNGTPIDNKVIDAYAKLCNVTPKDVLLYESLMRAYRGEVTYFNAINEGEIFKRSYIYHY